jgi:hypothetical protein
MGKVSRTSRILIRVGVVCSLVSLACWAALCLLGVLYNTHYWSAYAGEGHLGLGVGVGRYAGQIWPPVNPQWELIYSPWKEGLSKPPLWVVLGFRLPEAIWDSTHFQLYLPMWLPVLVFGVPTGWLIYRARRRRLPGTCGKCGYDLTGNVSGRCPECGETMTAPVAGARS